MKVFMSLLVLLATPSVFAVAKEAACVKYTNSAFTEATAAVRLRLAIPALNRSFDLGLNSAQELNLEKRLTKMIAKGELNQDNFEKMVYFGCATDLTAGNKEEAAKSLKGILAGL